MCYNNINYNIAILNLAIFKICEVDFRQGRLQPSPPCLKIFPKNRPALGQVYFFI